ncbi:MAG: hypothetical protein RJA70_910 [Pseudomonadota bacterium]|jgi:Mg-chelatase subunit ChlD
MSFASVLALLVGLLVAAPVIAHLLRRGKTEEQVFPPAHLVPMLVVTSDQRSRLEDRLLLLMRALMIIALAILGATPFVRCSRLSVDRASGASVAMSLIVDDSQSMRAITSQGSSRFEQALVGATQLLTSAREGDAIAIVLAGQPARLLLTPTTDLGAATRALESIRISDRATDLSEAVSLARSSLKELPHSDKRVILLSDLAAEFSPEGEPPLSTPLTSLSDAVDNCGISTAERQDRTVVVTLGCSAARAALGRSLRLYAGSDDTTEPVATEALRGVDGEQRVVLKQVSATGDLFAKLDGSDAIGSDDRAHIAQEATDLVIGVVADPAKASTVTGGPTLLEQALSALEPNLTVKPLGAVPQSAEALAKYAALLVDDPPGMSPESRAALQEWIAKGGVALGLLGPSAASAQLAASLDPFAREGATWQEIEPQAAPTLDATGLSWLGPESQSLTTLNARGRVRLDAADLPGAAIVGRWSDGVPWVFRRDLGRGVVLTVGLPASTAWSDLSLRPGFLALLDDTVSQAKQRTGPSRSDAGTPWRFPSGARLEVTGPQGPLAARMTSNGEQQVTADVAGRYQLQLDGAAESRIVVVAISELTQTPLLFQSSASVTGAGAGTNQVDASPEWALFVLALLTIELLTRTLTGPAGARLRSRFLRRSAA